MEMFRDLSHFNLFAKLIVLLRQILLNLPSAAIAGAILMRIVADHVPSLHRVALWYVKPVTSSTVWPIMPIPALTSVVMLVMILLVSVLTSIPCVVAQQVSRKTMSHK